MSQKRRTTIAEPVCAALCALRLHMSLMYFRDEAAVKFSALHTTKEQRLFCCLTGGGDTQHSSLP